MNVSYKKLWKLLIDRDLKKKDLEPVSYTHLDVYKRQGHTSSSVSLGKVALLEYFGTG